MTARSATVGTVSELERVLREELSLYQEYAALLREDKESMIKLKVEALENSYKKKNTLLLKIRTADQARQNLVKQISNKLGIDKDSVNLLSLTEKLTAEEKKRLLKLREKLQEEFHSIRESHLENSALGKSSLAWINGSVMSLHQVLTPTATYDHAGQIDSANTYYGRSVEKRL